MFEATGLRATLEDASCVIDSLEGVAVSGLRAFYAVRPHCLGSAATTRTPL